MTQSWPPTPAVLLAGGLARRMGGGDKPLRMVAGRTLLARAIARLAPQCDGLVLSANGDPKRFEAYGLPVVADAIPGQQGPLAGLLAGLECAAARRPDAQWMASAAADCPFLPRDLVARLHGARAAVGADVAIAASGGRTHPVAGLWRIDMAGALRRALIAENLRKVELWAKRFSITLVEWPAEPVDPFFNVNTPNDLLAAERLAAIDDFA